jgi:hypothetical protein
MTRSSFQLSRIVTALTVSAAAAGCGGDALSPARDLSGTWETAFPVTFHIRTDFCSADLQDVATEDWMVTWTITPRSGSESDVGIEWSYTRANFTATGGCAGGTGYVPEPSPIEFRGVLSSSSLTLMSGTEEVGTFSFTTDLMMGTFDYRYCLAYCQETYTEPNALKLVRQ